MKNWVVVGDFDGTLTDAEQEGAPFWEACMDMLARETGMPRAEVDRIAAEMLGRMAADPGVYGLRDPDEGVITCPGTVDPYRRSIEVMYAVHTAADKPITAANRAAVVDGYFRACYGGATVFRPQADETLARLCRLQAAIVTDNGEDAVRRKLRLLGGSARRLMPHVYGGAKKWRVTRSIPRRNCDRLYRLPVAFAFPGLGRWIYARRYRYFRVLSHILDRHEASWENLLVFGDVAEIDLVLPWSLGATVILVANQHTPPWDRAFWPGKPRAYLVESLGELIELLDRLDV